MSMFCSDCAVNLKTGASAKYDAPKTLQLVMKGKPSSANTTGFVFTDLHPRSCFSSLVFSTFFYLLWFVHIGLKRVTHREQIQLWLVCFQIHVSYYHSPPMSASLLHIPWHPGLWNLIVQPRPGNQQSTWACSFQIVHRCLILPVHIATHLTIQKCASRFSHDKSRMNYF